mgnify:CR=1 FL=1
MKVNKIFLAALAAQLLAPSANALSDEGRHWVCQTEAQYRALLSARLYGVGSEPEIGCQPLPAGIPIEQLSCVNEDLHLCRYRWMDNNTPVNMWGSAIISTIDDNPNQ